MSGYCKLCYKEEKGNLNRKLFIFCGTCVQRLMGRREEVLEGLGVVRLVAELKKHIYKFYGIRGEVK